MLNLSPARLPLESREHYQARRKEIKAELRGKLAGKPLHTACVIVEEKNAAGDVIARRKVEIGGTFRRPKGDGIIESTLRKMSKAGKKAYRRERTRLRHLAQDVKDAGGPEGIIGALKEEATCC